MKKTTVIVFLLILLLSMLEACDYFVQATTDSTPISMQAKTIEAVEVAADSFLSETYILSTLFISETEAKIIEAGLIDIKTIDTTIEVDLKYSTKNNFLGIDVYGDFNKCYLQPDVAAKLSSSQSKLKTQFPFYSLVIYDAARSRSIQRKMWDTIDVPYSERSKYVSNPNNGSLHNFGAAVDLSIIDEHGFELDMGTAYDYFGELAYPREEERMLEEGRLTRIQILNRALLRDVMESSGFMGITSEWWHFNSCNRTEAYEKYKIIE